MVVVVVVLVVVVVVVVVVLILAGAAGMPALVQSTRDKREAFVPAVHDQLHLVHNPVRAHVLQQ